MSIKTPHEIKLIRSGTKYNQIIISIFLDIPLPDLNFNYNGYVERINHYCGK